MVTEEKFIGNVVLRYRLGTILIWLGVLTWAPFLFLKAIGESPSFLLFLPFHLMGVMGGARMRSLARKELGLISPNKSYSKIAGHLLIVLGILVWVPYLYLKIVQGQPVEVLSYLPYHLSGIFGGLTLYLVGWLLEHKNKRTKQADRSVA